MRKFVVTGGYRERRTRPLKEYLDAFDITTREKLARRFDEFCAVLDAYASAAPGLFWSNAVSYVDMPGVGYRYAYIDSGVCEYQMHESALLAERNTDERA